MDCAVSQLRSSEPSSGGGPSPPPAAAAWAFLPQEATGDSECDGDLAAAAAAVDADDGDAESCSGGEDCSAELDERRLVSWQCWMVESASVVVVGAEAARPAPAQPEDDGAAADGDADSDRLFWEACIAHGY
ncbi:hypothetical protein PVAP13_5KG245100 [Panicum virgatum]|uniref:Uncharacterized protein n=1 Tax=Panicum virgatum TaxID=38727 RepID=A0A8T0SMP6_PANVG|nr:hypothetical protein PVAP13_5KG245100 [Panicum virgatum]